MFLLLATALVWTLMPMEAWATAGPAPQPGDVAPDARTPYFRLESAVSVGNKGEESLNVSVDAPCGRPAWLFDHAELVVKRSRFGDVQFIGLPRRGCVQCDPVLLRWFHEPTGYLSFEVNVYRRLEVVSCPTDYSSPLHSSPAHSSADHSAPDHG